MIEKIITVDHTIAFDFFGPDNRNINALADAFHKVRTVARGHELKLIGPAADVEQLEALVEECIRHVKVYGQLSEEAVERMLQLDQQMHDEQGPSGVLISGSRGNVIKPKSAKQVEMVKAAMENDLIFALGPAGTGKTFLAVALAVRALKNKEVKRIIITRPAVEAGENLGFLPGDLKEKIDPYLRPIYDALDELVPQDKLKFYLDNRIIEIAPLAYMRGRTLQQAFVLLDEAQNTTPMQMKMFLTRLGKYSRMIITGDLTQIDLPTRQESGLTRIHKTLMDIPGVAFIQFSEKDVQRHPLVERIIKAYEKVTQNN